MKKNGTSNLHSVIVTITTAIIRIVSTASATATAARVAARILWNHSPVLVALIAEIFLYDEITTVQVVAVHLVECLRDTFSLLELDDTATAWLVRFVIEKLNERNLANFASEQVLKILPPVLVGNAAEQKVIEQNENKIN